MLSLFVKIMQSFNRICPVCCVYFLGGRNKNSFYYQKNKVSKLHVSQVMSNNSSLLRTLTNKKEIQRLSFTSRAFHQISGSCWRKQVKRQKKNNTNTKAILSWEKFLLKKVMLVSISQFNVTLVLTKLFIMVKSFL